jgi:hypothetical protein
MVFDLETNIGTLAKVMIDGNSPAFVFGLSDNYRGGAVILGILTVPFFLLFGESLLVLRAVAMLFSLGALVIIYLFIYNFFNRKAAILASLLFILSPPNYIRGAFVSSGGYTEMNFFSLLAIFLFYKIFFAEVVNRKHLFAFFGVLSGFALFYDYTFLLTLSCCLLFWFSFDKKLLLKNDFYIFVLFFLIGFSPWFYYNLTHNWNAVFIMREESLWAWFTKNSFLRSLTRLKDLIVFDIPGFFRFRDLFFFSKNFISNTLCAIFAISFIGILWAQRGSIARFFKGLIPLRRFNITPRMISPEVFLIIYALIFMLAYAFCGTSYLAKREVDIVFPHRFLIFLIPSIFMITSIFLVKITNYKYGVLVSRVLAGVLITISLISNLGMISIQNYMLSTLPEGYNYVFFGKQLRYVYNERIEQSLDSIKKIDRKDRRFFYEGYKWAVPEGKSGFSTKDYVQKIIMVSIDKDSWPFAYEHLGRVMGRNLWYDKFADEELKSYVDKLFYPYFYLGLGRGFAGRGLNEHAYNYLLGKIDKQYWRYFREGMGMEMDALFIDNIKKFSQFMAIMDIETRKDIYGGFAEGKEYPRMSYNIFSSGFGKITHSVKAWKERIDCIEEEFKPYCYQRLGIEIGWRFIYDIKGCREFLQKAEEKYRPYIYKGLGMALGWRFGSNINGCELLIRQIEQKYWTYAYEGLGAGVVKRYGYQLDERAKDSEKIPVEYKDQFRKGLKEAALI